MKTTHKIFKEVLKEFGFENYKLSEMTSYDYWICTKTAMERYAEQFKYDFSKDCVCENRSGETYCCNQCGLPVKYLEIKINQN